MPIQNFNIYTAKGYAGDLCDSGPRVVQTGILVGSDATFGIAVKRNTTVDRGIEVGGQANIFAITQREYNHEADTRPSDGKTSYKETQSVSLIREGYVYVEVTSSAATTGELMATNNTTGAIVGGTAVAGETQSTNLRAQEDGQVGDIIRARLDIV